MCTTAKSSILHMTKLYPCDDVTLSVDNFVHPVDCLHYWHPTVGNIGTNDTEGLTDGRI